MLFYCTVYSVNNGETLDVKGFLYCTILKHCFFPFILMFYMIALSRGAICFILVSDQGCKSLRKGGQTWKQEVSVNQVFKLQMKKK